jgi:protein gp37
MSDTTALVFFDQARMMLEKAVSIDQVKDIRDKAEALRLYARQQKDSGEMQQHCAEIKIRAERRAWELLAEQSLNGGDRKSESHDGRVKLGDLGIDKHQSSRWQTIAVLPQEEFEAQIAETKAQKKELTSSAVYDTAKKYRATQHPATQAKPVKSNPHAVFNRTTEMVDWARWTWNPVTGCLHNCVYCYARDIAEGRTGNTPFKTGFAPTFYPERLAAPHNTKVSAKAPNDIGERNVFVCSMADLFGKWVAQQWIDEVMDAVRSAPQWNFLFLTKFPQRLETIDWPGNAWVGTTVDEQYRVDIAEKAFRKVNAPIKWLSCEPLRERLTFGSLDMFDWVVVGGQSRSSQEPAFQPPWEWVEHLWRQARDSNCLLYWKPNLLTRPQEYPQAAVRLASGDPHA